MITALCAAQGVDVSPMKKIRTTIDNRHIELYYAAYGGDIDGEDSFGAASRGDYIPVEGPSRVVDEDASDIRDGAGVDFHDADFEDNLDRIIRGD
ncbi:hypothetical protein SESBI_06536 [Sesbania bispinosa]|nr:hypothetical protein SESBI_06536 [Sesbania bispinosa]